MPVTIVGNNTPTAGGVVYGDGTNYASTAAGTSGQVLTSAGSSAPTWATAASAMTFISVSTVSGTPTTVDITSGISSTYDDYLVVFSNVASTAASQLFLNVYKSAAFQTTLYTDGLFFMQFNGTSGTQSDATGGSEIKLGYTGLAANKVSGYMYLSNANSATAYAQGVTGMSQNSGSSATGGNNSIAFFGGNQGTAAVVTGLRFYPSGGTTFTSGTFRLYGLQKA